MSRPTYLTWSVVALVAYTLVAPLVSYTTREIPTNVVAFVTNAMLATTALVLLVTSDTEVLTYATHPRSPYLLAAGICLSVGILAYYQSLATGPISVVVPVFGMFVVTSSLLGFVFFDESVTARKVLGILLAAIAIYLVAGE